MSEKGKDTELDKIESSDSGALEIGYLTSAILDYYETTGKQEFEDGEWWKDGTIHDKRQTSSVPEDLDKEIKKAFMFQIKKFQK